MQILDFSEVLSSELTLEFFFFQKPVKVLLKFIYLFIFEKFNIAKLMKKKKKSPQPVQLYLSA
jgi:hypothetical protein